VVRNFREFHKFGSNSGKFIPAKNSNRAHLQKFISREKKFFPQFAKFCISKIFNEDVKFSKKWPIRESLFAQNFSKNPIRESLFPQNAKILRIFLFAKFFTAKVSSFKVLYIIANLVV